MYVCNLHKERNVIILLKVQEMIVRFQLQVHPCTFKWNVMLKLVSVCTYVLELEYMCDFALT